MTRSGWPKPSLGRLRRVLPLLLLSTCAGGTPVRQVSHRAVVGSHADVSAQAAALSGAAPSMAGKAAREHPPLLRYARIEAPAGARPLSRFHGALRRAADGRGKARILFYGDSHVASDFMTGRIRDLLQERFGDGGPGFVMAGKPWRSHRHERFVIEARNVKATRIKARLPADEAARLGLAGVAFDAEAPQARVRLSTRPSASDARGKLRGELFFLRRPDAGSLRLSIDGRRASSVRTRASREKAGYHRFELSGSGAHEIAIEAGGGGPVTWYGVALERDQPGVVLDTLGIPGARARAQLSWQLGLLRDHVRRRAPDLIVLAYGTNECGDAEEPIADYEAQLREVVKRMRSAARDASCVLVGPSDRLERTAGGDVRELPRTAQLVEVQRRIAREQGCGYFDLISAMGGPRSMARWASSEPRFGAGDLVHLTRRGYAAIGDVLTEALLEGAERVERVERAHHGYGRLGRFKRAKR